MATLTGRTIGNFLILEELGRGGMGVVFKARQLSMDRDVALKFLPTRLAKDPKIVERFNREARAAGQLNHPNIVAVHDVGVVEGLHYIAMEYVNGKSVYKRIKETGPLGEGAALRIGEQIAQALKYAHNRGILHRDVKPDNFLMDSSGRVRLADMGLAQFVRQTAGTSQGELTQDGATVGTPHYMSPEQCRGQQIDERSDLYSLGASLFMMMTGQTPYESSTAAAVMVKVLTEPPRSLKKLNPELSDGCVALVEKLMDKDPAHRIQNAEAVASAINLCRTGMYLPVEKPARFRRFWPLLIGAGAALLLVLSAAILAKFKAKPAADSGVIATAVPAPTQPPPPAVPAPEPKKAPEKEPPPTKDSVATEVKAPPISAEEQQRLADLEELKQLRDTLRPFVSRNPRRVASDFRQFVKEHAGRAIRADAEEDLKHAEERVQALMDEWGNLRAAMERDAASGDYPSALAKAWQFAQVHRDCPEAEEAQKKIEALEQEFCGKALALAGQRNYAAAEQMIADLMSPRMPAELKPRLETTLQEVRASRRRVEADAAADRALLETLHPKALAKGRHPEENARYQFAQAAQIYQEAVAKAKTDTGKRDLQSFVRLYTSADKVMERIQLAISAGSKPEISALGAFKQQGKVVGWNENGLLYYTSPELPPQPIPWKSVQPESLIEIITALKIVTGTSSNDLYDNGAFCCACGLETSAIDKFTKCLKAEPGRAVELEPIMAWLQPESRNAAAEKVLAEAHLARRNGDLDACNRKLNQLMLEYADTEFVKKHTQEIRNVALPQAHEAPPGPPLPHRLPLRRR